MSVTILTGPPGSGKNTIATEYAKISSRCAVIDVDLLRWFIPEPHHVAPWKGESGHKQQLLGIDNTILLANSFLKNDYNILILDVISNETGGILKKGLKFHSPIIVRLLPSLDIILARNKGRPPRLKLQRIKECYKEQANLVIMDETINNSNLSPKQVARSLINA